MPCHAMHLHINMNSMCAWCLCGNRLLFVLRINIRMVCRAHARFPFHFDMANVFFNHPILSIHPFSPFYFVGMCVRLCVYERQTKLNYGLWNSDGECQCQNDVQLFKWIVNLAMRFVQINGWTHIHLLHITIDVLCFHRVFVCVIFNSIQFIWQLKLLPSIPSSANISLNLNRAWMDRKEESGECVRVK